MLEKSIYRDLFFFAFTSLIAYNKHIDYGDVRPFAEFLV